MKIVEHKLGVLLGHELYLKIGEPHSLTDHDTEGIRKIAENWLGRAFTNDEMMDELRQKYPRIYEELKRGDN